MVIEAHLTLIDYGHVLQRTVLILHGSSETHLRPHRCSVKLVTDACLSVPRELEMTRAVSVAHLIQGRNPKTASI